MPVQIVVTPKNNVEFDHDGNIIYDENGIPALKDPQDLGLFVKTHTIQVNQLDPQSNTLQTGIIFRSEIFWDKRRTPSPAFENPDEIIWLTFNDDDLEDEDEEFDSDEDESDSEETTYLDQ